MALLLVATAAEVLAACRTGLPASLAALMPLAGAQPEMVANSSAKTGGRLVRE